MDQSGRFPPQEPASVSEPSYDASAAESTVKRVSRQLAKPNVAGFQARLDREEYNATLKHVSSDKIDVLLDEFMVDVRSHSCCAPAFRRCLLSQGRA